MKKGICQLNNLFRGMVTVSDKGQIAIPTNLRNELKIDRGSRLIVLKRKDGQGFTCLKEEIFKQTFSNLSEDEGGGEKNGK